MQVVLLERVRNLGQLGDVVKVKAGYARNFLVPYGKALPATKANIAHFEQRRADLEKAAAETLAVAQKRAAQLQDFVLTIKRKTAEEGKLYGSVNLHDIVDAFEKSSAEVEKRELNLPAGTIRSVGEYVVEVHLHSDVIVEVKLVVEAE